MLQDHVREKYKKELHPNTAISTEDEQALVAHTLWMSDRGFPISRVIIKALALEMIKSSRRESLVNLERRLSNNWWSRFKSSNAYALDGPTTALYGTSPKEYMDELFAKWLHHFVHYAPTERPLVLIMD
ncbi:hypothetical protein SKAU_G00194990 [Synaphobranchus kaupii]|uniref:HTH CENPB-type domain-containing protein n=1 Tax=Synaphobranchus kaupii TaxID=118154 RepID=A0A9Q1FEP2_SYNKA|nr:hypothetical protein SKAU_G00194990 [Synaphobranchus kaupii]